MNVLERIPYEIWREIFLQIKDRWFYQEQLSTNLAPFPTKRFVKISLHRVGKDNRALLELSLICKAFWTVAEEVAYIEIALTCGAYEKFLECASQRRLKQRRLGDWTKSILLDHSGHHSDFNDFLRRLTEVCPNTTLFSFADHRLHIVEPDVWSKNWCQNLKVLHYTRGDLEISALRYISSNCPNVTQLGIFITKLLTEPLDASLLVPIIFPSVQRLGVYGDYFSMSAGFPSLKHLELGDIHGYTPRRSSKVAGRINRILEREGTKLMTLDLTCAEVGEENCSIRDLRIFGTCPNMQTFICRADMILNELEPDYDDGVETHRSLTHLVLAFDDVPHFNLLSGGHMAWAVEEIPWDNPCRDYLFIQQQSRCFNPNRFPNLKSVKIVMWDSDFWLEERHAEQLRAYAARHFPFADVEVCVPN